MPGQAARGGHPSRRARATTPSEGYTVGPGQSTG
jgi:hypothetical protein